MIQLMKTEWFESLNKQWQDNDNFIKNELTRMSESKTFSLNSGSLNSWPLNAWWPVPEWTWPTPEVPVKKYVVHAFNLDWTFKTTPESNLITTDVKFTAQINWWQGEAIIWLAKPFTYTDIANNDFVKIYQVDKDNSLWRLIYTWQVKKTRRIAVNWNEQIQFICLWLATLLKYVFFEDWLWSRSFTKNVDPAQIIKDVITHFNTKYSYEWISESDFTNIDTFWTTVNIDFEDDKCFDAIEIARKTTDFWWYIWQDWICHFKAKPSTADHLVKYRYDVNQVVEEDDAENIVNHYHLTWKSWTTSFPDGTSQTNNWLMESAETNTELADATTRDSAGDSFIAEHKDEKAKTVVEVNSLYDIETIKPLDTITVMNNEFWIENVQINKLTYKPDTINLNLEDFDSLWKTFLS
jgi:hypothetical protein